MFYKENTARKQTEELLQERLQFEEIIMTISLDFINLSSKELDHAINSALQIICKFIRADCACVFLFRKDSEKTNEINRWEANGLSAEFAFDKLLWSAEKINRAETIIIDCMDDLPPQAAADKKEFNSFGIKSCLMIPLINRGEVIGVLGFNTLLSEKKWEKNYVILLKIAGIIIVNALVHRWEDKKLISLKKAVETSGEVIFLTDQSGMITYVNPEFTKVYGHAASEVLMKTTPRILKSGIMDRENYELFWKTILSKQTVKGEFINKTKDGRMINIEGSANPILDDNGEIIGFLAIQRDITERKQMELKTNG